MADPDLVPMLRQAALRCRQETMAGLEEAYRGWRVDGIGRSFFTKWFAFAGDVPDRRWQPLILDNRVIATLNKTLGVRVRDMTLRRDGSSRYRAYVEQMHVWAKERGDLTAGRLEWILFCHGGAIDVDAPSARAAQPSHNPSSDLVDKTSCEHEFWTAWRAERAQRPTSVTTPRFEPRVRKASRLDAG